MDDQGEGYVTADQMADLWRAIASLREEIEILTRRLNLVQGGEGSEPAAGTQASDPAAAE